MKAGKDAPSPYASPACLAGEIAPGYFDPLGVEPQQATDVARWRKAERINRLAARSAISVEMRQAIARSIAQHLDQLLQTAFPDLIGKVVSGYWPIKSEPDLRPWMTSVESRGARLALPVVDVPKTPLVFRPWTSAAPMERGHWNIPVPATRDSVIPDIALAPLVGWDRQGFRLGYGGGYFDRTLAAASPRPFTIGVGLQEARLATIFPQPHDIRLDAIVTETGLQWMA
ncbi:MAG: 5-formyltetrahydrofolate cyclo-ligase [Cereibacter sphaeroides]|uniref:5-formyltetrahydrofolate cyclo-ligase n=1 Tax=Cereibacter sphaeroides TaxID=1063 RepID=A0A2W5U159_CERSP|nr:MAG: 5-formyltetrahydrofolate cyclo-ligase [Cereibacter sphaeroides]